MYRAKAIEKDTGEMLGQHQFSCVSALPGLLPGELTHFSVHDFTVVHPSWQC